LYHESFTEIHYVAFALIWAALLVFSLSRTQLFIKSEQLLREFGMEIKEHPVFKEENKP